MFLEIVKSKNITYLYKAQYITVSKGKYKRTRELIGRLDELKKIYPDPISFFKIELENQTLFQKQLKSDNKINLSLVKEEILLDNITNNFFDENLEKNIGFSFLQYLFFKLDFDKLFKKIQYIEKTKINLSKLFQLLIYCRCLFPSSKLSDFNHQSLFAENFNLSKDDIYRGLDILDTHKDLIVSHLNNNISNFFNYELSDTHYDLTNYFVYTDNNTLLINKGYSKVKNGKPTIQQALLIDKNGLPINYKLFSGNRNDVSTLIEFLEEQKEKYKIEKSTIVADAGIISNNNMVKILVSKNQYIFKESLLRVNKNIMDTFNKVVKPLLENIMNENINLKGCYFSLILDTELRVNNIKGEIVKVKVPQKYIFMYSNAIDKNLEKCRLEQLENAEKYIKNSYQVKNTFKKLIPNLIKIDIKDIEVDIDIEKLNKYENTSGYSLLITSDINRKDESIIKAYKNQYLIEESFRIFKTDLDIDNIYLRKDERIQGHFLSGFISLTFLRILQMKLNNEYSISKIQEMMKEFKLHKIRNTNQYQLSTISVINAKLQKELGIKINQNIYDGKEIKKVIGNLKK